VDTIITESMNSVSSRDSKRSQESVTSPRSIIKGSNGSITSPKQERFAPKHENAVVTIVDPETDSNPESIQEDPIQMEPEDDNQNKKYSEESDITSNEDQDVDVFEDDGETIVSWSVSVNDIQGETLWSRQDYFLAGQGS
jgi:hypothetical protein